MAFHSDGDDEDDYDVGDEDVDDDDDDDNVPVKRVQQVFSQKVPIRSLTEYVCEWFVYIYTCIYIVCGQKKYDDD